MDSPHGWGFEGGWHERSAPDLAALTRGLVVSILKLRLSGGRVAWLSKRSFARNWSVMVVASLGSQALATLATIRIARALTPEGYGEFNLVTTLASLGTVIASLGLRNVVMRECARHPEQTASLLVSSALLRAGSLVLGSVGILVYMQVGHSGLRVELGSVAVGLLLGQTTWDLLETVAYGHQRMEYSAAINLVGAVIWAAAAWAVPTSSLTTFNVSLAFAALQVTKAIAYTRLIQQVRAVRIFPPPALTELYSTGRSVLAQSLPFYWMAVLTAGTTQLPLLFLAERSGQAEVGLYNAGFRLTSAVQLLLEAALTALYPGLSQAAAADPQRFQYTVRRALSGLTLLGVGGATAVSLIRGELVRILFGGAFRAAANAMSLQCWYVVIYCVLSLIGTSLAASDRQKQLAMLTTAYMVVAAPILWVGAGYGAFGLAAASLVAAIVNLSYHWVVFDGTLPHRLPVSFVLRLLLTMGVGVGLALSVPEDWPLLLRVSIALLVFTGCLMVRLSKRSSLVRRHLPALS
jgi:O-antigen/teichoic acid export membrane protein